MTPRISHLVGDWIDIFHETYGRVDSSQLLTSNRFCWGEGPCSQHVEKSISPAVRASVRLLSGHVYYNICILSGFSISLSFVTVILGQMALRRSVSPLF